MDLIFWLLVAYGLTYAVVAASITRWPRNVAHRLLGPARGVLECSTCCSFWVGLAWGAVTPVADLGWYPLSVAVSGVASMAFVNLLNWWPIGGELAALSPINRPTESAPRMSDEEAILAVLRSRSFDTTGATLEQIIANCYPGVEKVLPVLVRLESEGKISTCGSYTWRLNDGM